ncbi:glycoside hydrolase family 88 protein [Flammeovirga pacifica]|uniref:glycoside hydrolase family 88 protein n=1 Tax=Flammeovirga pacifica TaxID=915059 RepID=UPI000A018204|nr:glycoside hydrolase family 88 protein [Flammeovirga pacifica]
MNYFKCLIGIVLFGCAASNGNNTGGDTAKANEHYEIWNSSVDARVPNMLKYKVDSVSFPRSLEKDGVTRKRPSKDWTCGFYPGSLIQMFHITGDSIFLDQANLWLPYVEKEQWNAGTHDMGFKVFCSIGEAYKVSKNKHLEEVLLQSAKTLSTRFNPEVGCIKSWDFGQDRWTYPVIIDNMMNLELLFEASLISGDSSFHDIAVSHAENTMQNHYREDNSCYHVLDYNPKTGEVENFLTHQGLNVNSVWSRGQGWGLYGFTMCYRYTKDERFLKHAQKIASFIMNQPNMPEDKVPYWDMHAPKIPNAFRDVSSASIYASALYELYTYTNEDAYLIYADEILTSLGNEQYVLNNIDAPFILDHSTGDWPKNDEIDTSIAYADYYFLEAIKRRKSLEINM